VDGGQPGELVVNFLVIQSLRKVGPDDDVQKNLCTVRQLLEGMGLQTTAVGEFPLLA
jgi:hypothetical protein